MRHKTPRIEGLYFVRCFEYKKQQPFNRLPLDSSGMRGVISYRSGVGLWPHHSCLLALNPHPKLQVDLDCPRHPTPHDIHQYFDSWLLPMCGLPGPGCHQSSLWPDHRRSANSWRLRWDWRGLGNLRDITRCFSGNSSDQNGETFEKTYSNGRISWMVSFFSPPGRFTLTTSPTFFPRICCARGDWVVQILS